MIAPLNPGVASELATFGINWAQRKSEVVNSLDMVKEIWSERAAIREYLGGQSRWEAEQYAVYDTAEILNIMIGKK